MRTQAGLVAVALSCLSAYSAAFLFPPSTSVPTSTGKWRISAVTKEDGPDKKAQKAPTGAFSWPFDINLPQEVTKLLSNFGTRSISAPGKADAKGVVQQRKAEAEALKAKIKRMVAPTSRGFAANSTQRMALRVETDKLEAYNPIAEPVFAPEVTCTWSVLYAAPYNVTVSQKQQELSYLYGPVLSRLKDLVPKNFLKAKGEFQVIDGVNGRLTNIATFTVLDKYQGRFEIDGTATPVPPARFNVTFTNGRLTIGEWRTAFSLRLLNPTGYVDITYLDEDFRLTKGDKGTLFVVARVKTDTLADKGQGKSSRGRE